MGAPRPPVCTAALFSKSRLMAEISRQPTERQGAEGSRPVIQCESDLGGVDVPGFRRTQTCQGERKTGIGRKECLGPGELSEPGPVPPLLPRSAGVERRRPGAPGQREARVPLRAQPGAQTSDPPRPVTWRKIQNSAFKLARPVSALGRPRRVDAQPQSAPLLAQVTGGAHTHGSAEGAPGGPGPGPPRLRPRARVFSHFFLAPQPHLSAAGIAVRLLCEG